MAVGAFIDRRELEDGLGLKSLITALPRRGIPVVVGTVSMAELVDCVRDNRLDGLVVATEDEERGWQVGRQALHEAGVEPSSLKVLSLADLCVRVHPHEEATAKAVLLLAAAAAMVREYPRLRPENLRLRIGMPGGVRLSRRTLLTLPRPRYEVLPAVDESRCAAGRGCDLCLKACPVGAVQLTHGVVLVDKDRCTDCGLCLSACPTGAFEHPAYRRSAMDAGLVAMLGDAMTGVGERIIAFACRSVMGTLREAGRRRLGYRAEILPMEVPSTGFIDLYLVLRAFDLGAAGVLALGCDGICNPGCEPGTSSSRFSAVESVLDLLGIGSGRLALVRAGSARLLAACLNTFADHTLALPPLALRRQLCDPAQSRRHDLVELLAGISRRLGTRDAPPIEHDSLPFGVTEVSADSCSLCGLCSRVCPTRALAYTEADGTARLRYMARDCTGCGLCAGACPEGAIKVARRLDLRSLTHEEIEVKASPLVRCRSCGVAYAPRALLERVLHQFGSQKSAATTVGFCPDCRMMATAPGALPPTGRINGQRDRQPRA